MQASYTISEACEVVLIDRARFNEAVAAGHYPCAPAASHGRPRVFEEPDMIALLYYALLLHKDWPPRLAGRYACALRAALGHAAEDESVVTIYEATSGLEAIPGADEPANRPHITGKLFSTIRVDIGWLREWIRQGA